MENKNLTTRVLLIVILLAAFFLRQYRLLDFPFHGDEVEEGDIALDILHGHWALYYPQNEGNEPLFQLMMAPFFAVLGDSVMANRFPSAAWSTALVALMYLYVRTLFRSRRAGVMAAGLTAALWWPTLFGRLGLREISQPTLMIPALLGLVLALRVSSPARAMRFALVGGLFAGLTAYTFLSGRGFPVIVGLFVVTLAVAQRDLLRRQWRPVLVYIVLMVALTAPLFLYLAAHPELDFHVRDLGVRGWVGQGSMEGFARSLGDTLGMFTVRGDMNWVRNIPGRPVFPGPEGILFYLGVALCVWRWKRPEYLLQLVVLAVMLAPNVLTEDPPRWTRSIGILPGLLATTVLPLEWAWVRVEGWARGLRAPRRAAAMAGYALAVGLLGISIYARTASDMFRVWIDNPGVYWMTLAFYDGAAQYVNASAETTPFNYVMDYYTEWRKHNIQRPVQRKDIPLRFTVNDAFVFPEDARGGRIAFQSQAAPARPLLEAFLDLNAPIYVDARVDPEGRRPLRVYAVPRARLDEHLARARRGGVFMPDAGTPVSTSVQVSDLLQFLGYEILNPDARAGADLDILSYWRVLKRPPEMAVFIHLLDSEQQVVAQFDGLNVVPDELERGDTVVQMHTLNLPQSLAQGTYRLELGAYTRAEMRRLPLSVGGDHVWLQTWDVSAAR